MNFELLVSIFFPRRCVVCGRFLRAGTLCDACRAAIPLARTFFCGECHRPLAAPELCAAKSICHPDFPFVLGAAGSYKNAAMKTLVHALKFRGVRAAAAPLAGMIVDYAAPLLSAPDVPSFVAVPIPLSRKRARERGFNQAENLAKEVARQLGIPMDATLLLRTKHTKPQSEIENAADRKDNIRGCFAATSTTAIQGKNILLIDDVTTSGATFLEAAVTLKIAGAAKIIALAAAKA